MVEHEYTKEIVCPYCGWIESDSWEFEGECGEMECPDCYKKFSWSRLVTVEYSTHSDCQDNKEKHDFTEWEYNETDADVLTGDLHDKVNDYYMRKCNKCDKQEFMSLIDLN